MVEVVVPDITTVITQFVLVGGLILGAVKWLESKSDKKAIKAKEEAEANARDLAKAMEAAAAQVRVENNAHMEEIKSYNDKSNNLLETKIVEVDRKVVVMLEDLRKRADFTNGAVSSIRTDIADLQDELERISNPETDAEVSSASQRRNEKRRREKRRAIERDRIEQSENYLKHGRG